MSRLGKYAITFRLALSRLLVYRSNVVIGGANVIIWFGGLILLYQAAGGSLGGYSEADMITYILASSLFAYALFTPIADQIAQEIVEGDLINYLLRPINYFGYWTARALAVRIIFWMVGLFSAGILATFFWQHLVLPTSMVSWLMTLTLLIGSTALMITLEFIGGMFSFWTGRAFGARWLLSIFSRFLSGAALPIDLMPPIIQTIFHLTPFPSLIYAPVKAFLGQLGAEVFVQTLLIQWGWIVMLSTIVAVIWRRQLKIYAAYGS